ncbi:hypothetical protein CAPTEDRAFT_204885 [Capitella teleta]|uniref:Farnesoic acid O-methyl transferase domain-containing protein n=1 Tax=Capitella teleta TaxID=283909 RepID=R7U2Y6_CAPTE|nr:hypothetical protein CAPTEDRAFT_204885 [Capitella teleta]|eukprot:ELU00441.1 hypothetical protein CAPTEDRAFT_204885 [Capitella teleta]
MKTAFFAVISLVLLVSLCQGDAGMCHLDTLRVSTTDPQDVYIPFVNPYPENDHFFVGVKSCEDVRIKLNYNGNEYFEIILGKDGNSKVILQNLLFGQILTIFSTDMNVLDCDEVKYFWVRVTSLHLSFGEGLGVGNGTIHSHNGDYDVTPELLEDMEVGIGANSPETEFEITCGESAHCL